MSSLIRNCPKCGCEITYTNKYNMLNAEKKISKCKSCGIKEVITDDVKKKMSDRVKGGNNPMYGKIGELNPFFGKKHTDESKKKMIENKDYSVYKTDEFKRKMSERNKGKNNPMYKKSVYDIWLKTHGKDIADSKMLKYKNTQSINNRGDKNNMYGKPAPLNSGNGICGWYKDWFFRSLLELSYMINVIERYNLNWESGECEKFKINYTIDGTNKNYFPDFVLNDKYIIECKPKPLWYTKINMVKFEFAKIFCEKNNYIFKIRDVKRIEKNELLDLINLDLVKLTNKWKYKIFK